MDIILQTLGYTDCCSSATYRTTAAEERCKSDERHTRQSSVCKAEIEPQYATFQQGYAGAARSCFGDVETFRSEARLQCP